MFYPAYEWHQQRHSMKLLTEPMLNLLQGHNGCIVLEEQPCNKQKFEIHLTFLHSQAALVQCCNGYAKQTFIIIIIVKPDVLFHATLQTSAAMLVFWLAVCCENLQLVWATCLRRLQILLTQIPHQIPLEMVNFSWNIPEMISHGRKSDGIGTQ